MTPVVKKVKLEKKEKNDGFVLYLRSERWVPWVSCVMEIIVAERKNV
jgi:hypothetical protein